MQRCHDADAETLLSEIRNWWNSESGPKFGYVQLGGLHEPLHKPEEAYFGEIPDIEGIDRWRFTSGDIGSEAFEGYRSARELLYDTLIRYIDREIRYTLDELAELDDTVVIVTSDHGEKFWEYKHFEGEHFEDSRGITGVGHGHALIPPVLEVPIISNTNGFSSQSRRSLTDIVPTILKELGADSRFELDGSPIQEASGAEDPVLSQEIAYGPNQISVTDGSHHLIHVPVDERSVLIDFETGEEISDREVENRLLEHIPRQRATGRDFDISDGVQDRLSDLGYAE
jgi:hypothetical protein